MTSSSAQPNDVDRGTLGVEDLAVDELTVRLRARARKGDRPEVGVEMPVTHGTRFHRSDSGADRLPFAAHLPERVWRDRPAAAPVPDRSPASVGNNATLRIAPIRIEHDARDRLGALVNVLERSNATVLNAANDHVDTLQTPRLPNV